MVRELNAHDYAIRQEWIRHYVAYELKYNVKQQEAHFYRYLLTSLQGPLVYGKEPNFSSPQLRAVLDKVAVAFQKGKTTADSAHLVHDYFYHKYLDEIKGERLKQTGNKYSQKQQW